MSNGSPVYDDKGNVVGSAVDDDPAWGTGGWRALKREREAFGHPPPSADRAARPLSRHDAAAARANARAEKQREEEEW